MLQHHSEEKLLDQLAQEASGSRVAGSINSWCQCRFPAIPNSLSTQESSFLQITISRPVAIFELDERSNELPSLLPLVPKPEVALLADRQKNQEVLLENESYAIRAGWERWMIEVCRPDLSWLDDKPRWKFLMLPKSDPIAYRVEVPLGCDVPKVRWGRDFAAAFAIHSRDA